MYLNVHFIVVLQIFTYAHHGPKLLCKSENLNPHFATADYSKAYL